MHLLIYLFPVFAFLIALEAMISWSDKVYNFRFNDALSNVSTGVIDQFANAIIGTVFIGVYAVLYQRYAFFHLADYSILTWVGVILAIDFTYFLFHWASHRINVLWATHIGHHQSEHYNLTVSLRHNFTANLVAYTFHTPVALLGFSPGMFLVAYGTYQIWQFIVHTRLIKSVGPFEVILASPSLHRVHHARNFQYLDKNYGGLLNIWDRLFGSYYKEKSSVPPAYGITTGIRQWNPLWANFHYFVFLIRASYQAKGWNKIKVWFAPPDWQAPGVTLVQKSAGYDGDVPRAWYPYILAHFFLGTVAAFLVLPRYDAMTAIDFWSVAGLIMLTMVTVTALFDKTRWVVFSEFMRYALAACLLIYTQMRYGWSVSLCLIAVVFAVSLLWFVILLRRRPLHNQKNS